LSKTSVEVFC